MNESQRSAAAARTGHRDAADEPAPAQKRMPPNTCTVIHDRGSEEMHFNRENVEKLLAGDSFFWLDLDQPDEDDFEILRDVFKFHPLAVEDSENFGQRAKIDDYDDFVFIVVYGAVARRRPARRGALLLLRDASSSPSTATMRRPSPRCASAT